MASVASAMGNAEMCEVATPLCALQSIARKGVREGHEPSSLAGMTQASHMNNPSRLTKWKEGGSAPWRSWPLGKEMRRTSRKMQSICPFAP